MVRPVCFSIAIAVLGVTVARCAVSQESGVGHTIRYVLIAGQHQITPQDLYADVGDEIRWQNVLREPVRLGFLATNLLDELGCESGFKTLLGEVDDTVTIYPGEYVSLCFGRPGTIRYNVWTDVADPFNSMSPTGSIYLEKAA